MFYQHIKNYEFYSIDLLKKLKKCVSWIENILIDCVPIIIFSIDNTGLFCYLKSFLIFLILIDYLNLILISRL